RRTAELESRRQVESRGIEGTRRRARAQASTRRKARSIGDVAINLLQRFTGSGTRAHVGQGRRTLAGDQYSGRAFAIGDHFALDVDCTYLAALHRIGCDLGAVRYHVAADDELLHATPGFHAEGFGWKLHDHALDQGIAD